MYVRTTTTTCDLALSLPISVYLSFFLCLLVCCSIYFCLFVSISAFSVVRPPPYLLPLLSPRPCLSAPKHPPSFIWITFGLSLSVFSPTFPSFIASLLDCFSCLFVSFLISDHPLFLSFLSHLSPSLSLSLSLSVSLGLPSISHSFWLSLHPPLFPFPPSVPLSPSLCLSLPLSLSLFLSLSLSLSLSLALSLSLSLSFP